MPTIIESKSNRKDKIMVARTPGGVVLSLSDNFGGYSALNVDRETVRQIILALAHEGDIEG